MVGDFSVFNLWFASKDRRFDDVREQAIDILRNGYDKLKPDEMKRALAIIADMMDPEEETETNIDFKHVKHRAKEGKLGNSKSYDIAREVYELIGTEDTEAAKKQVIPPPPINAPRAKKIVAEKTGISLATVRTYYSKNIARIEEEERELEEQQRMEREMEV